MEERRDQAQVAGHRRLGRQQREHSLVDLEVATVDPVVVGEDEPGQLHVPRPHRLQRAFELQGYHVQPAHRLPLELLERFSELVACFKLHIVS